MSAGEYSFKASDWKVSVDGSLKRDEYYLLNTKNIPPEVTTAIEPVFDAINKLTMENLQKTWDSLMGPGYYKDFIDIAKAAPPELASIPEPEPIIKAKYGRLIKLVEPGEE